MRPDDYSHPELGLLTLVLGVGVAERLASAPGGWRTLTVSELRRLGLSESEQEAVGAMQALTRRNYPSLPIGSFTCPEEVAAIYRRRMEGDTEERVIAVALDGSNQFLAEVELARGGKHGAALTPADLLRPLIRAGASAFILVHNHPSGDASPSAEDIHMTRAVAAVADLLGLPLLDHVIVAARGGGHRSLRDLGFVDEKDRDHEERSAAAGFSA